jgi:hypothetical protein
MQKSAIEQIKELKAQLESKTEQAKAEALDKAGEAIAFLRELGLGSDTILKDLGFRGRATAKESREERSPKDEPCQICSFRTDPPHDGRAHRGQTKKRPLAAEGLEKNWLTAQRALSPRGRAESGEWQLGNLSGRYAGYWGAVTWLEYRELVNCSLRSRCRCSAPFSVNESRARSSHLGDCSRRVDHALAFVAFGL